MSTMYNVESRNDFKNSHLGLVFLQSITLWGDNVYSLLSDTKSVEQNSNKQKTCKSFDSCARYEVGKQ